ncbi:MAG: tRNA (N6-isopentenyl adenosine(37)-C2)-methylthiotransferase MiaB [Calditrichia bacterium]
MSKKKVYIETYGCQMNEYDTELVKSILAEKQYEIINNPEEADLVLVNTCSVRENANRKVYNRVGQFRQQSNGKQVKIGILGCMATNLRQKLLENNNLDVNFIAGPDSYKKLPGIIDHVEKTGEKDFDLTLSEFETYEDVYPRRESGVNAWIAVMRGCDNFCTFCVVPYTRGRERSRSVESVVRETAQLAKDGVQQITLLGQNVNSYNHEGRDFADLLQAVSEIEGIRRLRFTSPHPKDFPAKLLDIIAENPKVCKQIHLPLQAGNTRVLDVMNRTYTKEQYLNLVDLIKNRIPDVVLTTDIIVGFPTETDDEFEDTVDVMQQVEFDSAFIFKYSERENTVASRKYPDDVPEEKKTERIVKLNDIQKEISLKKNLAHVGQIHQVLIEKQGTKKSETQWQGRNDGNKLVILEDHPDIAVGKMIPVKIVDATAHVLFGKI